MNSYQNNNVWMEIKNKDRFTTQGDKDLKVSRSYIKSTRTRYGFSNLISAIKLVNAHASRIVFFLGFFFKGGISSSSLNPFHCICFMENY